MVFYKWDIYFCFYFSIPFWISNTLQKLIYKPLELIAFASTKKKGVPIFIGSLIVNGTCYDEIGSCAYNLLTILSLIDTIIRRAYVII